MCNCIFMTGKRILVLMALVTTAMAACVPPATGAETMSNKDCLECHNDKTLTKTNASGRVVSLFVDEARFAASRHGSNQCAQCHSDLKSTHPDDNLAAKPVDCSVCHGGAATNYAASVHGRIRKQGDLAAAGCKDCHGTNLHEVVSAKNADSPVFKMNLVQTCGRCHSNPKMAEKYKFKYPEVAAQYKDSIHGRALLQLGMSAAPSCNDCHGVHDIQPAKEGSSKVNGAHLAETCGKCHSKVAETWRQSSHGKAMAKGEPGAPSCADCHSAHSIESPHNTHFKLASVQQCGGCHQDKFEHYRETFHGKAIMLARPSQAAEVPACFDCHGHHDVLNHREPASRLSSANIVATCRQCHPGANASFAEYQPHANPLDKKNYPGLHRVFLFMTALLLGVFLFFGTHTLLWFVRSAIAYYRNPEEYRAARAAALADTDWFTRFTPFERFLHILVITSFLTLVLTGMPLKFYYTDWAKVVFKLIGGLDVARFLHRVGALVTFTYFGLHLLSLAIRAWRRRDLVRDPETGKFDRQRLWKVLFSPDSLIPSFNDFRELAAHVRWFFGRGEKPQFDRWTYWERFDYFAVFWGVAIIGTSGLIMWFPEFFTKFVSGWFVNVALIVHSDEALLAAGFIFTIHFFNTHFRLEKFPLDTVIFSGRISKSELMHERRKWYDRLVASGRLDQYRLRDEWPRWKAIVKFFGFSFFGAGVILLLLIIYAMVSRLF